MATTAQTTIDRAATLLHDTSYTRWPMAELLTFLSDGQRDAVLLKPSAYTNTVVVSLMAGVRQVPSSLTDLHLILSVPRNMANDGVTPGRVIRVTRASQLDDVDLNWHSGPQASTIVHYTYDPSKPLEFQTYPPAIGGTKVEVVYSAIPVPITLGATNIALADSLVNALVDYICYRALSKDAEYGDNATKAAAHYKLFTDALGVGTQLQLSNSPTLSAGPFTPSNTAGAK